MKRFLLLSFLLYPFAVVPQEARNLLRSPGPATNTFPSVMHSLTLQDALQLAVKNNSTILKALADLEANYGIVVQTRSIAFPKLRLAGDYQRVDRNSIETFPFPGAPQPPDERWSANIRLVQSIYEGGRIRSSLRAARLSRDQALANYQSVLADTLLAVRVAFDDVLLAGLQIEVQEASIKLLQRELEDTTRRFEAGTVPRFNQLRAEVELANARPRLIRARNAWRVGKNSLANALGYDFPRDVLEDIPLELSGKFTDEPFEVNLPNAITQALERRTELAALRQNEKLRRESVTQARAGYKPSVQIFGGYGSRNSSYLPDISRDISGWFAGVQASWDIFDGGLTRGRVLEARALSDRAHYELEDVTRRIELDVRTAYSNFLESKEVLASQRKTQEQAEEALRLATARVEAGTATQLDVLSAQTALTESRTTQILAVHDYSVARARLERAMGTNVEIATEK